MSTYSRGGWRGRGGGGSNRGGYSSYSSAQSRQLKYLKVPKQAANALNQYYLEHFIKLKKDADLRNITNVSMSYKRVIGALAKYPMPILCAQQTTQLEGVGDTIAKKFNDLIEEREKQFEQGLFEIELLKTQGKRISQEARTFAGLTISENEIKEEGISNMNLKEYLRKKDQETFRFNNGIEDPSDENSKKRKYGEISKDQNEDDQDGAGIKKKKANKGNPTSAFLDVGSVSWSMLIACYFLMLHDDRKSFYITIDSIKEMLDVLKNEFNEFIPFENDKIMIDQFANGDIQKFKENGFIELIHKGNAQIQQQQSDSLPKEWKFVMTDKGKNRAKNLCKSVGLQIQLETDLENPTTNKITINMYDKDLMPLVDDLYLRDGTNVQQIKQENSLFAKNQIFDPFVNQIENEIDHLLLEMCNFDDKSNKIQEQNQNQSMIMAELFEAANADLNEVDDDDDEDEKEERQSQGADDIIMDEEEKVTSLQEEIMKMLNENKENQNQVKTKKDETKKLKIEKSSLKQKHKDFESDVILFVDNREKKNQAQGNYLFEKLTETNVKCELKVLPVGDFLWVLRVKQPQIIAKEEEQIEDDEEELKDVLASNKKKSKKNQQGTKQTKAKKKQQQKDYIDYVLDFICERKTADDLAASIMDGRYEEQKFRLKHSDINNVIYLIEGKASQYCKIPEQVLNKACIHTQIFHGFNVLKLDNIRDTLKWLTDMTREIKNRVDLLKSTQKNFEQQIANSLIDFKLFSSETGKNSNLNVQQIFSRQLRTIKGLGTDHVSTISRVFKTPFILYHSYRKCSDEKQSLNLFNAGKMELMRNEYMYRQGLNSDEVYINTGEEGNPSLPRKIEDTDRINLENVINAADPKLFTKILRQFEKEYGIKMRKINKNQSQNLYDFFCSKTYGKDGGFLNLNSQEDEQEME